MAFIGGFGLAAQWAGIENVWYNDNEKYVCDVVRARVADGQLIDNIKVYEKDIREIGKHNLERVDIISGGFPCQPFSAAGKRKGTDDDRYLWPEMLRIIGELKPKFVIGENVAGLLSMENGETLKGILSDLENEGYNNEIFLIPACGVGAWHRRERIWIIAHSNSIRECPGYRKIQGANEEISKWHNDAKLNNPDKFNVPNPTGIRQQRQGKHEQSSNPETYKKGQANRVIYDSKRNEMQWNIEPSVGRVATRIPRRVDRLKSLGNAIVPQVAYQLFKAIKIINETT